MKYLLIGAALLGIFLSQQSDAASDTNPLPFALNLTPGAQTAGPDEVVVGLRGSFLYGENKSMFGADLAFGVANTKDTFAGIALAGIGNITGKQAYVIGGQVGGLFNINRGKANVIGFQLASLFNTIDGGGGVYGVQFAAIGNFARAADIYGAQVGIYNAAKKVVGIQLGLINKAESLTGIQIGLLNFCNKGTLLPVFPVVNIGI